jgi:hypothetical protein
MAATQIPKRTHGLRQDTWVIRVTLLGNSLGIWDKKTGGELDSDEVKYYPGGMNDQISLGGRVTPANVVLQRLYDGVDDHQDINVILGAVGHGVVTVSQTPMDQNGHPYGDSIFWHGILKRVLVPDVDSEATAAAMIEIEVSTDSPPHAA